MKHGFARRLLVAALLCGAVAQAGPRPEGDSKVFAPVPAPGYPEGVAVRGNRVYVSGPATFGLNVPPVVWEYDAQSGALLNQYPVTILNPFAGMRGLSCIAFGPDGKLYAVEPFVGIVRMELDAANTQSIYSAFPPPQGPTLLNDFAFDDLGYLYVTDSFAGAIYRIAPGGGAPMLWFQDARLLGNPQLPFGVNGIRIDKKDRKMYVSVTVRNDFSGAILTLPLVNTPLPGDLKEFHVYAPGQAGFAGPDGVAFGKSGKLYVALAGTNEISVLLPNGKELKRYAGPAKKADMTDLPWQNPANIAFDDDRDRILVTNHASLVPNPEFAVFDVVVKDKGLPLP